MTRHGSPHTPTRVHPNITIDGMMYLPYYAHGRMYEGRWNPSAYEFAVKHHLDRALRSRTGVVLKRYLTRNLRIEPNPDLYEVNAYVVPTNLEASTPLGQTPRRSDDGRPISGVGLGTGEGSDAKMYFTPAVWVRRSQLAGYAPDEVLVHELVHAIRVMKGLQSYRHMGGLWTDVEEFFAIAVANVYSSEIGRPLVGSHSTPTLILSHVRNFRRMYNYDELMDTMAREMPDFCADLATLRTRFNPFRNGG